MKKTIAIVLVGIMSLSLLTGCGGKKTEEQQAMEEIQQHMQDEATEDGVDLQGMMEQEAADAQARMDARAEEREARQSTQEELDEYYNPLLQAEFDALIAATTAEDTLEHGQRYNELFTERLAKDKELGVGCSYAGLDASYVVKALFLAGAQYKDYEHYHIYGGSDWNDVKMLLEFEKVNEYGIPFEFVFIKDDLSISRLDLAGIIAEDVDVMIDPISESVVSLYTFENAESNYYLFDITASEASFITKTTNSEDVDSLIPVEERLGEDYSHDPTDIGSIEELNRMIIRNTTGTASESYINY